MLLLKKSSEKSWGSSVIGISSDKWRLLFEADLKLLLRLGTRPPPEMLEVEPVGFSLCIIVATTLTCKGLLLLQLSSVFRYLLQQTAVEASAAPDCYHVDVVVAAKWWAGFCWSVLRAPFMVRCCCCCIWGELGNPLVGKFCLWWDEEDGLWLWLESLGYW